MKASERALAALEIAGERGLTAEELFEVLYGDDPEGGPLTGMKALYTLRARINRKLMNQNRYILSDKQHPNRKPRHTRYQLISKR